MDMPVTPEAALHLGRGGHDAVHAASVGLASASDAEILEAARRERRVVVTADLDYPRLLAIARAAEPSLILFRDGDWSEADVIARMSDILRTLTEVDIAQSIIVVDRRRVRRRRLPITK